MSEQQTPDYNKDTEFPPSNKSGGKLKLDVYMPLLLAVVMVFGMQLGFKLYETLKGKPQQILTFSSQISEIEEVFSYIDAKYVDSIDTDHLIEDVITETLKDLDPHSNYISPKDLAEVNESLQGNFEGIGVEFNIVKDTVVVVSPIAGGPSAKLGIQAGDKIIEVEDSLIAGIGITDQSVKQQLRGKKGTIVNVGVYREGLNELLYFPIKRDKIPLYSVDVGYMLDESTGYIKISRFSATTYDEFVKQLEKLKKEGLQNLMIDLRDNPGGYLSAAVNIVDELLADRKLVVYTEGRKHKRKEYFSKRKGLFEKGKVAILIDEGSASASEILAGAIQDWDRGTIIGRRSFGKGLVQEQYGLSNEGALRLTIARYYTPVGRCIQRNYAEGIEAYYEELNQRMLVGQLNARDSLDLFNDSLRFETKIKKRTVYGGGGVLPDVLVPLDTTKMQSYLIQSQRLMYDFIYDYFSHHRAEFQDFDSPQAFQDNYEVGDDLFEEYKRFLSSEIGFLDEAIIDSNYFDLMVQMKAQIARQLWRYDGFYPVINEIDEEVQTAYEYLTNANARRTLR